jgi:hypothetical protein
MEEGNGTSRSDRIQIQQHSRCDLGLRGNRKTT